MLSVDPRWEVFRRQMPVARQWAYFDHAAVAPISGSAQAALTEWAADVAEHGDVHWPAWAERIEGVRQLASRLLGADLDEVAFASNTTTGIHWVAEGFPWLEGDNVVTLADEFPSNLYPWMNLAARGVETRRVATRDSAANLEDIAAACDGRTRIVAVSWVNYASGWRNDLDALAEMAHARGAYLFVDAIQGLGVFPLDVRATPVDFLAADGHKWLLGPEGAGVFYLRREHLDLLRPVGVGWNSVVHSHDFSRIAADWKPSAARYEGGTWNMGGILALGASVKLLLDLGIAALAARLLDVTAECRERLLALGATVETTWPDARRSGIVAFDMPGVSPATARRSLLAAGVALGVRANRLRISPHAYTNGADIDRLIAALRSV